MRKFKFMSKAVVGMMAVAMTMGSLGGATMMQPIAVYAETGDLTATLSTTKVPQGKDGTEITFTVKKEGADGDYTDYSKAEIKDIKLKEAGTDVSTGQGFTIAEDKSKITVGSSAAANMYTVTIVDKDNAAKTTTADFEVVTQSFVVTADKVEATAGETTTITFTAGMGIEGEVVTKDTAATYTMDYTAAKDDEVTKLTTEGVLTIGSDVPANTNIIVTARQVTGGSATDTITISVKASQTTEPGNPTDPTGQLNVKDIDYETFTITIEDTAAKYAFLEVWKFGDKNATDFGNTKDKKSASYSYKVEKGKVTVDLSFLKLGKTAQGIKVYTDAHTTPVAKVIPKQAEKLTLKWDGKKAADFDYGKSKEGSTSLTAAVLYTAAFEYKGQYSKDWVSMADFKSVDHVSAGGTILVRRAATAQAPAGPEAKVKIASLPKAPTPTFDYKNGTVKITDKMKYGYDADSTKWVDGNKKGLSVETLRAGANAQDSDEVVVFVFTAGDGSKKLDSNVASVVLPPLALPADNGSGTIACSGKSLTYTPAKIGREKKDGYNLKGDGFESTSDAPTAASRRWKAIGSNGLDVEVGKTVYIRLAGVKGKTAAASFLPSKELTWTAPAAEPEAPDIDTITVEADGTDNPTGLKAGALAAEQTFKFKATAKKGSEPVTEGVEFTWKVKDPTGNELKEADGFTWDGATLKIAARTALVEGTYTVHAECGTATVTPAQIVVAAEPKVFDAVAVTLAPSTPTTYTITNFKTAIASADGIKVSAKATNSGAEVTGVSFLWSIKKDNAEVTAIKIGADGKLSMVAENDVVAGTYTITATATPANGTAISGNVTITLN